MSVTTIVAKSERRDTRTEQDLEKFYDSHVSTREGPLAKDKYVQEMVPKYGGLTWLDPDKWPSFKAEI